MVMNLTLVSTTLRTMNLFAVQTFLAMISAATGEARAVRGKVLDFHLRCSDEKSMNGGEANIIEEEC